MQVSLGSSSFEGMREVGGFGQPLHLLYPQIQAVLNSELGPEAASLLAEPVVDRTGNRIDWYAQGDPDQKPVRLDARTQEQQQPVLDHVAEFIRRGRELVERYAASNDPRRVQLGAMLGTVLHPPAVTDIFLVQDRPVIIGWGFAPDKPWDLTTAPTRRTPPASNTLPRDVAMPDIAMPELTSVALESAPSNVAKPPSGPLPKTDAPEPLPESQPSSASSPQPERSSTAAAAEPPLFSEAAEPMLKRNPPPQKASEFAPVSAAGQDIPLRYVVVGSRYFWSVFALAVALVAMAALWPMMGYRPSQTSVGIAPDAASDRTLMQAQQTETELRARLEQLSAQLAARRGQCERPASVVPATPNSTAADAVAHGTARMGAAPAVLPAQPAAGGEHPAVPPPASISETGSGRDPKTTFAQVAESAASPSARPPQNDGTGQETPISNTPPVASAASRPTMGISPNRALEDVLEGREPSPAASSKRPAPVAPPVKTEPTPDERREFADRMSAAGAATGEITATLLWNHPGDLDLVVRCPSGRQLDYRNPSECGGALDVDANSARTQLSDRPVENAFWPAGKAAPGTYEIAVRYAPRKDEQKPQETPFQVRLIRGGQESVFKGVVQPHAVTPVTTFTVER